MEPLEYLAAATGLPLSDVREIDGTTIGWRSVTKPELGLLGSDDVWLCEHCLDKASQADGAIDCPECGGHRFIHGYDANLRALPAVMEIGR